MIALQDTPNSAKVTLKLKKESFFLPETRVMEVS